MAASPGGEEGVSDLTAMLEPYGIPGDDVREAIEALDQVPEQRPLAVTGSVRAQEVVFSDGEEEVVVPIPGDEVYVSVAPYESTTHDCFHHALGGCQGELADTEVQVRITDEQGEVLVEETATTYANGFVGYWLPSGTSGTVTMTREGDTGSAAFDTGPQGATCITTLRLT
ncbi:CueP family metal-binding protein [Serinicoccus chungangensis]|uniref:CueP family metal-binding protein n=1 Tax=Serinicoccus chungangensis TaxID=767452 RepID=UPI001F1E9548|nr:CueP family metal-binding protein [Serinicoccus chungangensis]